MYTISKSEKEKVYILNGKYYITIGKVVFDKFDIGKLKTVYN